MTIFEYKRAVRTLGEVQLEDKAIIICRMKADGTITTTNCGDGDAREKVYATLRVMPSSAPRVCTTLAEDKEGGE